MENFNLLFNKWQAVKEERGDIQKLSKLERVGAKKEQKGRWHTNRQRGGLEAFEFDKINFEALCDRQVNHAHIACADIAMPIKLSTDYRLVVGLGNSSIYETSMTLHHVFGFPYIPATGVKGALRNFIINKYFPLTPDERGSTKEENYGSIKEKNALKAEWFCRMFGCEPNSGRKTAKGDALAFISDLVFFDAYPTQAPKVTLDVMTVHYPDYYGEKKLPPADWQSPNPITFLTVVDTPFQFLIGYRNGAMPCNAPTKEVMSLLEFATRLLNEMLQNQGLGAKTAVGYGYFKK
jgi:CRISPR-associated protein Cmr6